MNNRLTPLFAHRRVGLFAALIGVLLTVPALWTGLNGDDFYHRVILLKLDPVWSDARPALDLFALVPGDERQKALEDVGILSWWADPELKIELFRPLGALTHVVDYALWPDGVVVQHLHSILWYGVAVFLVALLYREVHGSFAVAGLAALLWAVEDSHAMPAAWIANRHALLSTALGVGAIICHLRWRRDGRASWMAGAIITLALGLFSGEVALSAVAYIFAWQLSMDDVRWPRRLAALSPYALVVIVWRTVYNALGYGTEGTGLYIDPGRHPLEFSAVMIERWPILQAGQWFQLPVDIAIALDRSRQIGLAVVAVLLLLPLVCLIAPVVKERREARFWAVGMCLSAIPACAAFPMDRLLIFVGIGACGLLALLAESCGSLFGGSRKFGRGRRYIVAGLLVLHGPVAAVLLVGRIAVLPEFGRFFATGAVTAPSDDRVSEQTLVFINGQDFPVAYTSIIRLAEGAPPAPRRLALLSSITSAVEVHREDGDTLVLTAPEGLIAKPIDLLLRRSDLPFTVGQIVARPDFQVEVRAITHDGRPESVAFHFHSPLDDPSYRWLCWSRSGAQPWTPPAVGHAVELPMVPLIPSG